MSPEKKPAFLGGTPAFPAPLHVGRPNLGDRQAFLQRVEGILDRRWLTNDGPLVKEFESRVCDLLGVACCVAMCNGTVALEIASRALGFRDEVIVPAYTFVATAHALQWQGITPRFVDIDPGSQTIDPRAIDQAVTPRTKGIMGVHLWGQPCDTRAIESVAQQHSLGVMYDASHAFGCAHLGQKIGAFGACEVFSFHATKLIQCFEGGAVVTNDQALAAKMRLMRNFGFAGYDRVVYPGTNGKMSEVSAAMGLTSLDAMDEILAVNRDNDAAYRRGLAGIPGLSLRAQGPPEDRNHQYVVAEIDAAEFGLERDTLIAVLQAENILARRYFWPGCHRLEPYGSLPHNADLRLPHTDQAAARSVVLPTGQGVNPQDIEVICRILRQAAESADRICISASGLNHMTPDKATP